MFTSDFKFTPYWWDAAPPIRLNTSPSRRDFDVVVVGSGLTGVRAAIPLVRRGRSVLIVDSGLVGGGAARRNAGFLGRVLKKSYSQLRKSFGPERAKRVYGELDEALQTTMSFIEEEGIACHLTRCGRFVGATSENHLRVLEEEFSLVRRDLGTEFSLVERKDQEGEFATDAYFGGVVVPDLASLHPGLYHQGMLNIAIGLGVEIDELNTVNRILPRGSDGRSKVVTDRGDFIARDVIVATNGYTQKLGWFKRRVIPFTGYMAATEPLPPEIVATIIPHRRTVLDSNVNIDFFRPAPDTSRILFGGATASGLKGPDAIGRRMAEILDSVIPALKGTKLSHVWDGQCAGTFDMMPHMGHHNGVWFGLGYNFAGVPMGSYFGKLIAQRILGEANRPSIFETDRFPTIPGYTGASWFMPWVMRYFDWTDGRLAKSKAKGAKRERS